jgi:hypothetical protein
MQIHLLCALTTDDPEHTQPCLSGEWACEPEAGPVTESDAESGWSRKPAKGRSWLRCGHWRWSAVGRRMMR